MIREEQTTTEVDLNALIGSVQKKFDEGARLIQIGCGKYGDLFEINYSFDTNGVFSNIRITIGEGVEVPSISKIYLCAFIYENEIHDLFGIKINDIAIDFKGNLIKTSIKNPFNTSGAINAPKAKAAKAPTVTKVKAEKSEEA